ncbi:MAG: putative monooxygenase, partial [Myxococcaceae bacterium]|nr:putative monooxygenase [Myxococcaceae bacterium]
PPDMQPAPDQTRVEMWTMPDGQTPQRVIYRTGVLSPLNGSSTSGALSLLSSIPANAAHVVGESTLKMSSVSVIGSGLNSGGATGPFLKGEIVGMTPHAHAWATRMLASLTPSGAAESCLIDVPDWDYNWQLDYLFSSGVPYGPDDLLHVECDYDNTADNQPVINGQRRPVQAISFGENTLNEMCLHYLWLRFAYADFHAANP